MKNIIKAAVSAAITCLTAVVMSVCVFAETADIELSVAAAKDTNGKWGQSVEYTRSVFDCASITPDTQVIVEFELKGEWIKDSSPVEFVLHDFSDAEKEAWAPVFPEEYTNSSAVFTYQELLDGFGGGNLADVDKIYVGDCGIVMKVTKITITNCTVEEGAVETTAAEEKADEEITVSEAAAEETTASEENAQAAEEVQPANGEKSGQKIPILLIVVVTVVVAAVVVTIIVIRKHRGRFY